MGDLRSPRTVWSRLVRAEGVGNRPHARIPERPAYSCHDDPGVPAVPDDLPVWVYDDVCAMCSASVRILLSIDGDRERHRFVPAQSPLGEGLYRHYGLSTDGYDTVLVPIDGRGLMKSEAVLTLLQGLGMMWSSLAPAARLIPACLRDAAYGLIAKNRFRIWGRLDACRRPPRGTEARFLT